MQAFVFQPVRHKSGIFRCECITACLRHDLSRHVESARHNMKSKIAIKFPIPYEQWSNAPPRGRLSSSNSLPPGQQKTSNARGMPGGGGCLSFDLTGTLQGSNPYSQSQNQQSAYTYNPTSVRRERTCLPRVSFWQELGCQCPAILNRFPQLLPFEYVKVGKFPLVL